MPPICCMNDGIHIFSPTMNILWRGLIMREKPWPELNVVESISATKNRRAKHNRQDRLLLKKMQYLNTWLMVWGLTLDAKTSFCWLYSAAVFGNELPVNIVSFDVPWFYQRDLPSAGLHHASLTSGISRLSGTLYYMIGRFGQSQKFHGHCQPELWQVYRVLFRTNQGQAHQMGLHPPADLLTHLVRIICECLCADVRPDRFAF